jgi:hypothetical protein
VEAKYGTANVLYGQDPNFPRGENTGFANSLVSAAIVPKLGDALESPSWLCLSQHLHTCSDWVQLFSLFAQQT